MDVKITLTLTVGEVLALQELTEELPACVQWKYELLQSLRQKSLAAYHKPPIEKSELAKILAREMALWEGHMVKQIMVARKEQEVAFYYDVPIDHE